MTTFIWEMLFYLPSALIKKGNLDVIAKPSLAPTTNARYRVLYERVPINLK